MHLSMPIPKMSINKNSKNKTSKENFIQWHGCCMENMFRLILTSTEYHVVTKTNKWCSSTISIQHINVWMQAFQVYKEQNCRQTSQSSGEKTTYKHYQWYRLDWPWQQMTSSARFSKTVTVLLTTLITNKCNHAV